MNETFVKKYLSGTNPTGHVLGSQGLKQTIVGVVRDSKYTGVDEKPDADGLLRRHAVVIDLATMHIEVRTRGDAQGDAAQRCARPSPKYTRPCRWNSP